MRKVLAGFLALLMLCAGASAESLPPKLLPESYFLADIQRNYPDWSVRVSTRYGSGRYEGEMAQYTEVSLYRITDEAIELLELTALVNPIREGDDVPWSVHALIPVEIVPGAADDSYGVEVAKLAGLPDKLIARARAVLKELESGAPKAPAIQKQTSDQVSLMDLQADAIREKLAAIQVETLTPIEAMNVLYQLKQLL